jgi:hypothetical protein
LEAPTPMTRRTGFGILATLMGVAAVFAAVSLYRGGHTPEAVDERHSVVDDRTAQGTLLSLEDAIQLSDLSWAGVDGFMRKRNVETLNGRDISILEDSVGSIPGRYLLAFFSMLHERPDKALELFDSIPLDQIPDRYLYPPYRLKRSVRPDESNRYVKPLKNASVSSTISPLIRARFLSMEGDPQAALHAYLRTDPARWVSFDGSCLRKINQHSGLRQELRMLIAGALRSGRVKSPLAERLRTIVTSDDVVERVVTFKKRLKRVLDAKGAASDMAFASAKAMLTSRKTFLEKRYDELLIKHRSANPTAVTTETALLVFLSATALQNAAEIERWGQELKRRYPDREVERWVSQWMTTHD